MQKPPLQRWSQTASSPDPTEQAAIEMVRELGRAPQLPPEATDRITAILRTAGPVGGGRWWIFPIAGAAVAIATLVAWGLWEGAEEAVAPTAPERVAEMIAAPVPEAPPPVQAIPPAIVVVTEAEGPPEARLDPAPRRKRPAAAIPESALVEEARLLGVAVEQLRKRSRPAEALVTLERYFTRYPAGALRAEAEVIRVDALLATGQKRAALAQLERLHRAGLGHLPRRAELSLQHAELLAWAERFAEARAAFEALLASSPPSPIAERALFGRAVTRAHLGDAEGMRADLLDYLERHPNGRFAAQARERLSGGSP